MKIKLEFKIQDMWLGVFWKKSVEQTDIWICLIPTFPIHIIKENKHPLKDNELLSRLFAGLAKNTKSDPDNWMYHNGKFYTLKSTKEEMENLLKEIKNGL